MWDIVVMFQIQIGNLLNVMVEIGVWWENNNKGRSQAPKK